MQYTNHSHFSKYKILNILPDPLHNLLVPDSAYRVQSLGFDLPLRSTTHMSFRELDHEPKRRFKHFLMVFIGPLIELIIFASDENSNNKLPVFLREQLWPAVRLKNNGPAFKIFLYFNLRGFRVLQFSILVIFTFCEELLHVLNRNVSRNCFLWNNYDGILLSLVK